MEDKSGEQGDAKSAPFSVGPKGQPTGVGKQLDSPKENNWVRSNRRHNEALEAAKRRFGGETFARAPFDLIDTAGRFIEVKVGRSRYHGGAHQWRIVLTREEVRFARLKPVFLYVVWGENISLIPVDSWLDRLGRCAFQKTTFRGVDRWSTVFDIPIRDLNRYLIYGIPTDLKGMLNSVKKF